MARKYFVEEDSIKGNMIYIIGEDIKHISKVTRKVVGDKILVNNFEVEIVNIEKENIVCKILNVIKAESKDKDIKISLFQGLPKLDKMEYIIQKAVEIGVNSIIPVATKNSVVKFDEKRSASKIERWNKISKEAAKQSGRDYIPKVEDVVSLNDAIGKFKEYDKIILAYENETVSLKEVLFDINKNKEDVKSIAVIVGPEGGFDKKEVDSIIQAKGISVSLGKNILRTETASLCLLWTIIFELND